MLVDAKGETIMLNITRRGEQGQIAVMLAFAMIGLLAMAALAIDGGMLYWNQRRAQNGADAAAIAGVAVIADAVYAESYNCATSSETLILDAIKKYASNNDVPDAASGENVTAYYLTRDSVGNLVEITHSADPEDPLSTGGDPWAVGDTGHMPCDKEVVGLRVVTQFPQKTFMAGVIGIIETNVTVDASAIHETIGAPALPSSP
jgi:Flp pilus assembly protein TadG